MHRAVLLKEAIDGLNIKNGDTFVDGTLGEGGHSEEVYNRFGEFVNIIAIDLDQDALYRASKCIGKYATAHYAQGSFRNLDTVLDNLQEGQVGAILLDVGISSNQFENSGRGFSFQKDEPLIMSFKSFKNRPDWTISIIRVGDSTENDLTAREIVNTWDEENIKAILEGYGEEKFAWKIARAIVAQRKIKPLETTFDLVEIIKTATPKWYHHRKIHPATKTFQALRIAVNDELESLKEGISKGFSRLKPHGRLAIISFHSLEDRIVKRFYKAREKEGQAKIITQKPIIPSLEEIKNNPKSRSAKLRILEKI